MRTFVERGFVFAVCLLSIAAALLPEVCDPSNMAVDKHKAYDWVTDWLDRLL